MMVKDGIDLTSVEGASTLPYAIPHLAVELHTHASRACRCCGGARSARRTPRSRPRRSSTSSRRPRARIPVEFRRALLAKHPRHLAALELAARRPTGASRSRPARRARSAGAASRCTSRSAPSSRRWRRSPSTRTTSSRVDRVVCAVDCGIAVNPDVIRAQMEGGIGFGLSAALYGKITLKDGVVEQSNFHDYPILRINEMPAHRGAHRAVDGEALRRGRAGRAGDRAGGRQRAGGGDRQARARAAAGLSLEPRAVVGDARSPMAGTRARIRGRPGSAP